MSASKKILLNESEMPQNYYNIQADMPNPMLPPLHPGTKQPIGPRGFSCIISNGINQTGSFKRKIY